MSAKRLLLLVAGLVLLAANTMIILYGFNILKFDFEIEPVISFLGHGWFFWFFVALTMLFNISFVITVAEEFKSK